MGSPIGYAARNAPTLAISTWSSLIPRARGNCNLDTARKLSNLLQLEANAAASLVKASRQYQQGLWVSEGDPSLSWLYLISAVETAANYWREGTAPAEERLKNSKPDLHSLLEKTGGQKHVTEVAKLIADSFGATKKFVDFLIEFLPDPPIERPPDAGKLPWEAAELRRILRTIYKCRSKALHGGIQFPAPMCEPPMKLGDSNVPVESPAGLATAAMGGVWVHEKDAPMHLHIFEHIVRGALGNWWDSLVQDHRAKGAHGNV